MADDITIEQREAQPVVEVAAESRLWQIPKALERGFGTAREHIEGSSAQVEGMPYARYLKIDWDKQMNQGALAQLAEFVFGKIKMRIGLFSSTPLASAGEAIGTEIPAGRYATTIHRGAYHKVGDSYRRVWQWARENGVMLGDYSIENYIDDPTEMATEEVRTRLWIPVMD